MWVPREASGRCRCPPDQVQRYRSRISGPLLDRIDMQIEVPNVPRAHILNADPNAESSEVVRQRVIAAREKQIARANKANAYLSNREVDTFCTLTTADRQLLCVAIERLGLSARSTHRILKVARTIADLAGSEVIAPPERGSFASGTVESGNFRPQCRIVSRSQGFPLLMTFCDLTCSD